MNWIVYYHIISVVSHPAEVIKDQYIHAIELSHQETHKDNHLFITTDYLREFINFPQFKIVNGLSHQLLLNHFNSPPFLMEQT